MTSGIGNPDWQRRYTFSAVPLSSLLYAVAGSVQSPVIDANGYTSILVNIRPNSTTAYLRVEVFWYQDSAGTILIAATDFVHTAGAAETFNLPAVARYFNIVTTNVGGGTTGSVLIPVYGTLNDNHNMLTQQTATPQINGNQNTGAGVTYTLTAGGTLGGPVTLTFADDGNNKWFGEADYYDWPSKTWIRFLLISGTVYGQTFIQTMNVPYSTVRMSITNQDTVNHVLYLAMVGP